MLVARIAWKAPSFQSPFQANQWFWVKKIVLSDFEEAVVVQVSFWEHGDAEFLEQLAIGQGLACQEAEAPNDRVVEEQKLSKLQLLPASEIEDVEKDYDSEVGTLQFVDVIGVGSQHQDAHDLEHIYLIVLGDAVIDVERRYPRQVNEPKKLRAG